MTEDCKLSISNKNEIQITCSNTGARKAEKYRFSELTDNPSLIAHIPGNIGFLIGKATFAKEKGLLEIHHHKLNYKYLSLISTLILGIFVSANILGSKVINIFSIPVTGGFLLYPISYIFDYLISDVYGLENARRVFWSLLASALLISLSLWLFSYTPYTQELSKYQHSAIFVFGHMSRIFFASSLAMCLSFILSSFILQKVKKKQKKNILFHRFFKSLIISEFIDNGTFLLIGFWGILSPTSMVKSIVFTYMLKTLYELTMYRVITKPIIDLVKRSEKIDTLDGDRRFTLFGWKITYTDADNIYHR